ncbi:hypothetical protein BofuT4_P141960.1 [Botrytis cinerea T4]|uniref:Uncharacterized protein n=1 Tax=Botryotinia fuckeliana (strain T4) TaxID=999810 RepID=G2YZ86_BOTF4|nr:hypothetical protein BofuT4_P141960.1 [Botrytis cinerea T4]
MNNQHYSAPPPYTSNAPTFNPQNAPTFDATRWLLDTQRQFNQPTNYRNLLCQIFHAPDHWWDEFLAICALSLHPRFCHSNTSVWNFYNTLQIREMRSEYLTGGRSFTNETGEVCNWLAFCLRELRNQGIEWNLDASGSSSGTRREKRERRQDDSVPWLEWWWDGDIVRFTLND